MGRCHSKEPTKSQGVCPSTASVKGDGEQPVLTKQEFLLLRKSWKAYRTGLLPQHYAYIFCRLFVIGPRYSELFHFVGSISEPAFMSNQQLLRHVERIMNAVGYVVGNLDRRQHAVVTFCYDLGVRHVGYGARPEYLQAMVGSIIYGMERKLNKDLTPEVLRIWIKMFDFLTLHMTEGMQAELSRRLPKARARRTVKDEEHGEEEETEEGENVPEINIIEGSGTSSDASFRT